MKQYIPLALICTFLLLGTIWLVGEQRRLTSSIENLEEKRAALSEPIPIPTPQGTLPEQNEGTPQKNQDEEIIFEKGTDTEGFGLRLNKAPPGPIPDLPSPEEGTVMFWIQAESIPPFIDTITLFSSTKVEGLGIHYKNQKRTLEAGLPVMESMIIPFSDGQAHNIAYTFKAGEKQELYFDGQVIAAGVYRGPTFSLTGAVVGTAGGQEDEHVSNMVFFNKKMSQEEIIGMIAS